MWLKLHSSRTSTSVGIARSRQIALKITLALLPMPLARDFAKCWADDISTKYLLLSTARLGFNRISGFALLT